MLQLDVAVVMRETADAVKLCFWDDRLGHHNILWAPKGFVKTECHAGDRDIVIEIYSGIAILPKWQWVEENERLTFLCTFSGE